MLGLLSLIAVTAAAMAVWSIRDRMRQIKVGRHGARQSVPVVAEDATRPAWSASYRRRPVVRYSVGEQEYTSPVVNRFDYPDLGERIEVVVDPRNPEHPFDPEGLLESRGWLGPAGWVAVTIAVLIWALSIAF